MQPIIYFLPKFRFYQQAIYSQNIFPQLSSFINKNNGLINHRSNPLKFDKFEKKFILSKNRIIKYSIS